MLTQLKRLLKEKGARNSANDAKTIQAMHDHTVTLGAQCAQMSEALDFSHSDLVTILTDELHEDINPRAYILDIFDTYLVYSQGYDPTTSVWSNECFSIDYSVAANGEVTWGMPQEVVRKVTYVPTIEDEQVTESAELSTDYPLVEKAVRNDGTVMLKLISPGWGSSGYYSADVLKRDGPNVFKKGLHNLIDHPTPQEESARPEGSIHNLGSTLVEDARWYDDYQGAGAGLYAPARVVPGFADTLSAIAANIGTSIRASGKVRMGEAEGRKGAIVESIDTAKSVDYVTLPGRGGKVLELMESARSGVRIEREDDMPVSEEQFNALQESNRNLATQLARLQEAQALQRATTLVERQLSAYPTLPAVTRTRLLASLPSRFTLTDAGIVDEPALIETVKNAVSDEMSYLGGLGMGRVMGMGTTGALKEAKPEDIEAEINANLSAL